MLRAKIGWRLSRPKRRKDLKRLAFRQVRITHFTLTKNTAKALFLFGLFVLHHFFLSPKNVAVKKREFFYSHFSLYLALYCAAFHFNELAVTYKLNTMLFQVLVNIGVFHKFIFPNSILPSAGNTLKLIAFN